ncbi:MAG: gamma-glutamylcyclotransferase [Cyanobacteria bacterium P01_C01_bin.89]
MPTGHSRCPDSQGFDPPLTEPSFLYFAYGSCMCPVDLQRTFGEPTRDYALGPATLQNYRLGFNRRSQRRDCGVLDIVRSPGSVVHGVLYQLPWRLSDLLDEREEIPTRGYRQELITVTQGDRHFSNVRTYVVVDKLPQELAPNDWYFNVVMRGATTCGLPEDYCWKLFHHMHKLQQKRVAKSIHKSPTRSVAKRVYPKQPAA